jgi:hypothetical protein
MYVSGIFNTNKIEDQLFQLCYIIDYANNKKLKIGFKKDTNLIFKSYFSEITEDEFISSYIIFDFNYKNFNFSKKTKEMLIDVIYANEEKMYYTYNLFNKIKLNFDKENLNYECDENNNITIESSYIITDNEDDYTKLILMASFLEKGANNSSLSKFANYINIT